MGIIGIIIGVLIEGLIYGIVSLGVYITYKILDFPDMTVDGCFPLGMSVTAILLVNSVHPIIALIISFLVGVVAGIITGVIHVKFGVRDLLSGIIVMTGLYSVNLIIAGRPNLPVFQRPSIFNLHLNIEQLATLPRNYVTLFIMIIITIVCKVLLDKYLKTKSGYLLRSVGDNEILVTSLAVDKGNVKIMGLAIANGLVALGGSIYTQDRGFFEISAGTGTLVIAVANVIIGMQFMKLFDFMKPTTAVLFGSIAYRAVISIAISVGFDARDMKLITAILLLIILLVNKNKKKIKAVAK